MQRIPTLLQKIADLSKQEDKTSVIEIDLMLDYTRVLYADLLEWRNRVSFNTSLQQESPAPVKKEPIPIVEPETEDESEEEVEELIITTASLPGEETVEIPASKIERDIRSSIGINDKYQFISELFGNNKDAYDEVLTELNSMDTFDQAQNWLNARVATQYNWDEENVTVQMFYSTLSQFFASI